MCKRYTYIGLLLVAACEPGELAVPPYDRGSTLTQQIDLGNEYVLTAYFDLGTNSVVKTGLKYDWDLALSCSDTAPQVFLNSALLMRAQVLDHGNFVQTPQPNDKELRADHHSHIADSLALHGFVNSKLMAIIDLGVNDDGSHRGFVKMMAKYDPGTKTYEILHGGLSDTQPMSLEVTIDDEYNYMEVNLSLNEQVQASPVKSSYDLYFGQYTFQFYDPYLAYLVNGVLINPFRTHAAAIEGVSFEEIKMKHAEDLSLSPHRDIIGYDWKFYDLNLGLYSLMPNRCYIIRDQEGFYYKLRFTDFYSETGDKGSPKFEFQKL